MDHQKPGLRGTGRRMAGVGLIEILIAIVILAFGLLGIAAMQATALRNSQSALEHSQATVQTYAILDAMRANRDNALIGKYDFNAGKDLSKVGVCGVPEIGETLASADLHNWAEALHEKLGPSACGQIECNTGACKIAVKWDDSRGKSGVDHQIVRTETIL